MRKNIIKIVLLGVLIILCLWQTSILWLGNMSSHNFLGQKQTGYNITVVQPKAIWLNIGDFAYNINEKNDEYIEALIIELMSRLRAQELKVDPVQDLAYSQLLGRKGMIYEYGTSLTLEELIGPGLAKNVSSIKGNEIFIDLSEQSSQYTNVYLIDEEEEKIYRTVLKKKLEIHESTLRRFNENSLSDVLLQYQASSTSNQSEFIKGNVFYLPNNQSMPIRYDEIQLEPVIKVGDQKEVETALESYVNTFFTNPFLKQVNTTSSSIVFSEDIQTIVRYSEAGTLEFKKTSTTSPNKLTKGEKMFMVSQFIEECKGIPEHLRQSIYLDEIIENSTTGETRYRYGYKYNGFDVIFGEKVKEELEIEAPLEITVKNNQIVQGKWIMLKVMARTEQKKIHNSVIEVQGELTTDINTVINKVYDQDTSDGYRKELMTYLECAYVITDLRSKPRFNWAVLYDNQWLYYE